jgi:ankyrin repeat protein
VAGLLLSFDRGKNVNKKNTEGCTSLIIAAKNGHQALVKLLVDLPGVDTNA